MDQTAPGNLSSLPSSIPNTAQQNLPQSSGKPKRVVYVLLIVLTAGLGIGGYFLGGYVQSKKVPVASTTTQEGIIPAGYIKAQELISAGGNMVGKSDIQIGYNGVLTVVDPGRSWSLRKNNKIVTIRQEGSAQIKYSRITVPNTPGQSIEASDLKVGDALSLITSVDTKTGVVTVTNVIITPKPGSQATPSATPAAQKP